jgi:hypothetical protein
MPLSSKNKMRVGLVASFIFLIKQVMGVGCYFIIKVWMLKLMVGQATKFF